MSFFGKIKDVTYVNGAIQWRSSNLETDINSKKAC